MTEPSPFDLVSLRDTVYHPSWVLAIENKYPHRIKVKLPNILIVRGWLADHMIDYQWTTTGLFCFKDQKVAVMIKLAWG